MIGPGLGGLHGQAAATLGCRVPQVSFEKRLLDRSASGLRQRFSGTHRRPGRSYGHRGVERAGPDSALSHHGPGKIPIEVLPGRRLDLFELVGQIPGGLEAGRDKRGLRRRWAQAPARHRADPRLGSPGSE